MRPYTDLPEFSDVYLEDSFVLAITATPGIVKITLDVVLLPSHRQYSAPERGEQYCYTKGTLLFSDVTGLVWTGQGAIRPAVDASGETDYGGVDLYEWDETEHRIAGDWGRIVVETKTVSLALE